MRNDANCVKSIQIRSFFWSLLTYIRTEYGDLLRIQSAYRKMRTKKNFVSDRAQLGPKALGWGLLEYVILDEELFLFGYCTTEDGLIPKNFRLNIYFI